jgi:hypothetical protein
VVRLWQPLSATTSSITRYTDARCSGTLRSPPTSSHRCRSFCP